MNIASPSSSMVPAFPLANRAGDSASPASEPQQQGKQGRNEKANAQGLDSAQLKQLTELKARDREVRAHEAAHQAVGGQYAGAISYVYERGPDGAQYAVGGEVSIDTSPVEGDPQATIEKMRTVRAAALAPAEPSPQDRAVAAQAMQIMLQAQSELSTESAGADESQNTRSDSAVPARVSQGASDVYQSVQSVSGTGEAGESRRSSGAFQATA
jgi:hypothetical protein